MGMIDVNLANLAALNGRVVHIVYKTFKKGQKMKSEVLYFETKEAALGTIMSALNCAGIIGSDLVKMSYGTYDDQGHAVVFLTLYDKDGVCLE